MTQSPTTIHQPPPTDIDGRPRIGADIALPYARRLTERLRPACQQIGIAGSLRRGLATVHDIDIVAQPIAHIVTQAAFFDDQENDMDRQVASMPVDGIIDQLTDTDAISLIKRGPKLIQLLIETSKISLPVDIYLAQPDGSNYNALLQLRTGPKELNQLLAERAQDLHLEYRAGYGIFDPAGNRRDDGSEESIFYALGWAYTMPSHRHKPVVLAMYRNGALPAPAERGE